MKHVAVIGGGASGLVAAYFAAERGSAVTVFEKQKKIGRKILVTGNGRCNITNRQMTGEHYNGGDRKFATAVLNSFGFRETVDFFSSIGQPLVEEEGGRMYPRSLQASSVVRLLEYELLKRNVCISLHRRIDAIARTRECFCLTTAGNERHNFDSVILATGSCAYSPAGASSLGYELAESLNHRVRSPFPAILPINIPERALHRLQGTKVQCRARVLLDEKQIDETCGELLFTGYGISGPVALDLSRTVNEKILKGLLPFIEIDLFPALSSMQFRELLESLWKDPQKSVSFSLTGILRQGLSEYLCNRAGAVPDIFVGSLTEDQKESLVRSCKGLRLTPGDPRGFSEAVVAAGGVDVHDIDPLTMESKKVRGLYITGELIDVDGKSGGYNLQFAWSTGAIAGRAQ